MERDRFSAIKLRRPSKEEFVRRKRIEGVTKSQSSTSQLQPEMPKGAQTTKSWLDPIDWYRRVSDTQRGTRQEPNEGGDAHRFGCIGGLAHPCRVRQDLQPVHSDQQTTIFNRKELGREGTSNGCPGLWRYGLSVTAMAKVRRGWIGMDPDKIRRKLWNCERHSQQGHNRSRPGNTRGAFQRQTFGESALSARHLRGKRLLEPGANAVCFAPLHGHPRTVVL